jgi:phosphate starvation-inducible PhoH-like protein
LSPPIHSLDIELEPADNERLAVLCGQFDQNLRQLEERLGVEINSRGNRFRIIGDESPVQHAGDILQGLYAETAQGTLTAEKIHLYLRENGDGDGWQRAETPGNIVIRTPHGTIMPRGVNQNHYLQNILANDLNFGIGVLVRPAGEAGERLGFLPGDMSQKVDPYLRPLYDALYEMLGIDRVAKLIERNVIEVAPLAFMRGRSLNDAFIILDEGQNTTVEQMKMFLTRIGFGSTAVVTGDITQIDLPKATQSGLRQVIDVLKNQDGISFTFFASHDVVRHPLVQRIITAYDSYDRSTPGRD